ncbi:hypothetical protein GO730_39220 [Spirosoma sp. HMF3257]|nr:hypothetical protein [Spirosoma telluris]
MWSTGHHKVAILASSAGSEIDAIIDELFPDGIVKVIDVEESTYEEHEAIFRIIHAESCEETGNHEPFNKNLYKPFQLKSSGAIRAVK